MTQLIRCAPDGSPQEREPVQTILQEHALIEIPGDINSLQKGNAALAVRWREATRRAFTRALAAEYTVREFYRSTGSEQQSGVYLLTRGAGDEASAE